jgi:cysteine dioxygenase
MDIDQFVDGLCRIPASEFTLDGIETYMRGGAVDVDSLAPFVHFTRKRYTRNLIYRCPMFELMAICWDVGQTSRIHNHAGQNCWMAVAAGKLEVQNYEVVAIDPSRGYCELVEANRFLMDPAHPGVVEPEMPVHAVINPAAFNQQAVTLHVYSRPYDRCLVYTMANRSYEEVRLHFDSEYGRLLEQDLA